MALRMMLDMLKVKQRRSLDGSVLHDCRQVLHALDPSAHLLITNLLCCIIVAVPIYDHQLQSLHFLCSLLIRLAFSLLL